MLLHAKVPLLGHHTSGVRSEWYRDDLKEAEKQDPLNFLIETALQKEISQEGKACWPKDQGLRQDNTLYVLHSKAPFGSILKIENLSMHEQVTAYTRTPIIFYRLFLIFFPAFRLITVPQYQLVLSVLFGS